MLIGLIILCLISIVLVLLNAFEKRIILKKYAEQLSKNIETVEREDK